MTKRVKPPYHEYKNLVRRFNMALAASDRIEKLVANMMAATVVTMMEMSDEQIEEIRKLIDGNSVRVLKL